jgi:hypothetical protein
MTDTHCDLCGIAWEDHGQISCKKITTLKAELAELRQWVFSSDTTDLPPSAYNAEIAALKQRIATLAPTMKRRWLT